MIDKKRCKRAQVMKMEQKKQEDAKAIPPRGRESSSNRLTAAGPSKRQGVARLVVWEAEESEVPIHKNK